MRRRRLKNAQPDRSSQILGGRIPLALLIQTLAVAEFLNFRHAANALGVAQSSVSARVKALEEDLGVHLFERHARGVRLGAIIFVAIAITAMVIEMNRQDEPPRGRPASELQRPADPLRQSLRDCQRLGEATASDPGCLATWAENRDRFLDRTPVPATQHQNGAVIPAAMITGIRSDLPGQITAQVTENVYDSPTGSLLLFPQGTRIIGQYDAGARRPARLEPPDPAKRPLHRAGALARRGRLRLCRT